MVNPFPDVLKPIKNKVKSKKKKIIIRGKIECTCGSLDHFYTTLSSYHDKDCIINQKKKGKKK